MQEQLPLTLMVCPRNRMRLRVAEGALIERVNRAIAAGQATTASGRRMQQPIDGGLLREDGQLLYPIIDEIPLLLADEAIALDSLGIGARE